MNRREIKKFLEDSGFTFQRTAKGSELWKDRDGKVISIGFGSLNGKGWKNAIQDVNRIVKSRYAQQKQKPVEKKKEVFVAKTLNKFNGQAPDKRALNALKCQPGYLRSITATPTMIDTPVAPPPPAELVTMPVPVLIPKIPKSVHDIAPFKKASFKCQKNLYDTITKTRARKEIKKFIKKHLDNVNRNEMKYFCLPGTECFEIFQICDDLGIKRSNIYCVERIKERYDAIVAQNLGVKVFHTTVKEYFEHSKEKFHVISLDYQGHLYNHTEDLRAITKNENMADECVVYTNFCGAREKTEAKALYTMYQPYSSTPPDLSELRKQITEIVCSHLMESGKINYMKVVADNEFNLTQKKKESLDDFRQHLMKLNDAKAGSLTPEQVEQSEIYQHIIERYTNTDNLPGDVVMHMREKIAHIFNTLMHLKFQAHTFTEKNSNEEVMVYVPVGEEPRSAIQAQESMKGLYFSAQDYFDGACHWVHALRPLKYVGYSNMPMHSDLFFLKKDKSWDTLKGYLNDTGETIADIFLPLFNKNNAHEIKKVLAKCWTDFIKKDGYNIPERENLGSESLLAPRPKEEDHSEEYDLEVLEVEITAEPPVVKAPTFEDDSEDGGKEDEVIHHFSKKELVKKARSMLLANPNMTSHEIAQRTGASVMTAAACRAHRTMGTYKGMTDEDFE